jgi:hypothetical protein
MKGISLSSVIQVINLERQSCDIEAQADGQSGQLHFRGGTLVDAMADGLAGEDAAYEILAWDDPEFEVTTEDSPRDRTIEADLTQMLLETARRQDEEIAALDRIAAESEGVADDLDATTLLELEVTPDLDIVPKPLESAGTPAGPPAAAPLRPVSEPAPQSHPEPAVRSVPTAGSPSAAAAATAPAAAAAAVAPAVAPAASPAVAAAAPAGALNVAGLRRVIKIAQDGLGDALLSADLFSSVDGTSYVGVNSQPAGCALLNQLTERMTWSFDRGGLPPLGRYYLAELADAKMLLVAPSGAVHLDMIVDSKRVQLGLLLNVILPEVLAALDEVSPR